MLAEDLRTVRAPRDETKHEESRPAQGDDLGLLGYLDDHLNHIGLLDERSSQFHRSYVANRPQAAFHLEDGLRVVFLHTVLTNRVDELGKVALLSE